MVWELEREHEVDEEEEGREEEHDEVHRVVGVFHCVEQHIEPNKTAGKKYYFVTCKNYVISDFSLD